MKVYTYGPENFPSFAFVYGKEAYRYYKVLKIKSGPLSKWGFSELGFSTIAKHYEEYEGDFPPEVKREAIYGIFGRVIWN